MVAVDLIDFTCRASGEGELAARDVWKRKVGYHVCVYATSAVLTLPIIVFAVLSTFTAYEPIVALSSIGGCFISDTATGKWVGFLLVTVPKAVGLLFNCAAYVIAVQRVCSRRFPTVVGRRHAAQTSRFLLVYLLCYAAPAVRHIWVLLDTPTSMWYEILQFVESILLPLAGFLNAVVYGLNRNFSTGSGLRVSFERLSWRSERVYYTYPWSFCMNSLSLSLSLSFLMCLLWTCMPLALTHTPLITSPCLALRVPFSLSRAPLPCLSLSLPLSFSLYRPCSAERAESWWERIRLCLSKIFDTSMQMSVRGRSGGTRSTVASRMRRQSARRSATTLSVASSRPSIG